MKQVLIYIISIVIQLCHCLHKIISDFFWLITIYPTIYIAKHLDTQKDYPATNDNSFHLDILKRWDKIVYKILIKLYPIYTCFSGKLDDWKYLEKIMNWHSNIPLMGFIERERTYLILVMDEGSVYRDARTIYPLLLQKYSYHGLFKKIRERDEQGQCIIDCRWITGNSTGTIFSIYSDRTRTRLNNDTNALNNSQLPDAIFYTKYLWLIIAAFFWVYTFWGKS